MNVYVDVGTESEDAAYRKLAACVGGDRGRWVRLWWHKHALAGFDRWLARVGVVMSSSSASSSRRLKANGWQR